jgi:hypothetical protein
MSDTVRNSDTAVLGASGTAREASADAAVDAIDSMLDAFVDDRAPGAVVGTALASGVVRRGVDREGVIGIDNGALRMQPLIEPGWGRSAIAYGPFRRQNGLAFGAFLLNGHNTSQAEPLPDGLKSRVQRWALGAETEGRAIRIRRFLRARQRRYFWRRLLQWIRTGTRFLHVPAIDQNMAVGWFPAIAPSDPQQQGNGFVMHALGPECGELRARVGARCLGILKGVQNVPLYYFVVLREEGAAYYAASIPGVPGVTAFPAMRPLAIDAFGKDPKVYAGVHQSVLGQIGWRVDTRVYAAQVSMLDAFRHWFGSAHAADRLCGTGDLHDSPAEVGGTWRIAEGCLARTSGGVVPAAASGRAMLSPGHASGLIHAVVHVKDHATGSAALLWRVRDEDNFWCFEASALECRLSLVENGIRRAFPAARDRFLTPNSANTLQVMDDGASIQLSLNGEMVYTAGLFDLRLGDATGVGFEVRGDGDGLSVASFEAHPRSVAVPRAFRLGKPWFKTGELVVLKDDFETKAQDLAGLVTPVGGRVWRRDIGKGRFAPSGNGAVKVCASAEAPCPGRTAYTLDWDNPEFVDVSVTITPPGQHPGQREKGRGGLILWQDPDNYVTFTVFMDDWYGTSIAAFFQVDGYDELYDAVWTNVGRRIHWGVPYDFRIVCDGKRFLAFVDGEPVLYRAFSDVYRDWQTLRLARVGLVTNWEWGNDTGTVFERFQARDLG